MRKVACLLISSLVLTACLDDRSDDRTSKEVQRLAREGFELLLAGDVDGWLSRMDGYDSLPESYRRQLRDAMLMHMDKERRLHGGLTAAVVVGDSILDSINAEAFVELQYADSVRERIHLPVVKRHGNWKIK